jgi:hypothetical protein
VVDARLQQLREAEELKRGQRHLDTFRQRHEDWSMSLSVRRCGGTVWWLYSSE